MSGLIGEAFVRIRPNMSGFQQETESGFSKAFKDVAKVVGAALATEKIFKFGEEIVKSAANTKRATETIKDGFGAAGEAVTRFNEGPAAQLGISAEVGQQAAAKFATLFDTLGVGQSKAADMTVNLEKMAGGLAQIKGIDPSDVLDKLYAAATGSTRGLKSLGIVIDANTIKQKANELGLVTHTHSTQASVQADRALQIAKAKLNDALQKYGPSTTQAAAAQTTLEKAQSAVTKALKGTTDALTPAQKTQAIYAALMDKLGGIQKSAAGHSDDLANSEKRLQAQWANLKDTLGQKLLPIVEDVVGWFADNLPNALKKSQDKVQEIADKLRGPFNGALEKSRGILDAVADALQSTIKFLIQYQNIFLPLSGAIGGVTIAMEAWTIATEIWTTVTEVATAVQKAFNLAISANAIGITVLAIAALVGALVVLYQRSETVRRVIDESWAAIRESSVRVWGFIRTYVLDVWDVIKTVVVTYLKVIRDVFNVFKSAFTGDWAGAWKNVKMIFTDIWDGLGRIASDALDVIKTYVEKKAIEITLKIIEPFTHLPNWLGGGWAKDMKSSLEGTLAGLESTAGSHGRNIGTAIVDGVDAGLSNLPEVLQNAVANAWRGAQSSVSQSVAASPGRASTMSRATAPGASFGKDQIYSLLMRSGASAAEAAYLTYASTTHEDPAGTLGVINDNTKTHDYSVGLFQINFRDMKNQWMRGGQAAAAKLATNADAQAKYALSILRSQGPGAWGTSASMASQFGLGSGGSSGGGGGGGSTPDLTVGTSPSSGASVAQQIAAAKASLEESYKKVVASAKDLGGELTGTIKKDMATVRDEITHISSKGDVTTAKKNLDDLRTEISAKLKQIRTEIALNKTFDGLKAQVAQLGTQVTPQIKAEMKSIQAEIGKVSTPQQIANLQAQMTRVKNEIATQLALIKARIQTEQTSFNAAWQSLAQGADAAFQKATTKALASMQVAVTGAFNTFQFGGSITQTPAEAALASLQSSHDAAVAAAKLAADQAQYAADEAAGDLEALVADQAAIDDDLYQAKVLALQTQANLERDAATKQLQDAQNNYQDQRTLLQQQLDQRVADIQTGMLNGTIAAAAGMNMLTDVLSDPQYGIDMRNSGLVIGGQLYSGLSDGLKPVFDLIQRLIDDMKSANLLPSTAGDAGNLNGTLDPAIAAALRAAGVGTASVPGGATGGGNDAISRYLSNNEAIVNELRKQTALAEAGQVIAVSVNDGQSANRVAKAVMR